MTEDQSTIITDALDFHAAHFQRWLDRTPKTRQRRPNPDRAWIQRLIDDITAAKAVFMEERRDV